MCVFEEQIGQQQLLYQSTESIHSTMTADDGSPEKEEEEEEENEKEGKRGWNDSKQLYTGKCQGNIRRKRRFQVEWNVSSSSPPPSDVLARELLCQLGVLEKL